MPTTHEVQPGDCIDSIAFEHGFFPETVWNHPKNAQLRAERISRNILLPGDRVFVPDKRIKDVECVTDKTHRFQRKGVPAKLRVRFLDEDDAPRADVPYLLRIKTKSGHYLPAIKDRRTNSDGFLIESIPPDASEGVVELGEGDEAEVFELRLGKIDPIDEISGIQARLNNLGYESGSEDGTLNEMTRAALNEFLEDQGVKPMASDDMEISRDARERLQALHQS